jgi:hypothetical protein
MSCRRVLSSTPLLVRGLGTGLLSNRYWGAISSEVKRPGREADRLSPSGVDAPNGRTVPAYGLDTDGVVTVFPVLEIDVKLDRRVFLSVLL